MKDDLDLDKSQACLVSSLYLQGFQSYKLFCKFDLEG